TPWGEWLWLTSDAGRGGWDFASLQRSIKSAVHKSRGYREAKSRQSTQLGRVDSQGCGFLRSHGCTGGLDTQSAPSALWRVRLRPEETLDRICPRRTGRDPSSPKSPQRRRFPDGVSAGGHETSGASRSPGELGGTRARDSRSRVQLRAQWRDRVAGRCTRVWQTVPCHPVWNCGFPIRSSRNARWDGGEDRCYSDGS